MGGGLLGFFYILYKIHYIYTKGGVHQGFWRREKGSATPDTDLHLSSLLSRRLSKGEGGPDMAWVHLRQS